MRLSGTCARTYVLRGCWRWVYQTAPCRAVGAGRTCLRTTPHLPCAWLLQRHARRVVFVIADGGRKVKTIGEGRKLALISSRKTKSVGGISLSGK